MTHTHFHFPYPTPSMAKVHEVIIAELPPMWRVRAERFDGSGQVSEVACATTARLGTAGRVRAARLPGAWLLPAPQCGLSMNPAAQLL